MEQISEGRGDVMNPFGVREVQEMTKASNEVNNKTKAFENSNKEVKSPRHIPTSVPGYFCPASPSFIVGI